MTCANQRAYLDKAPADQKDKAHEAFQSVAFAYAILSDPTRRKRYDQTGSTSESIVDADGFDWSDFYREQFKDAVSSDAIEKFAKQYKGSVEEQDDLLAAYEQSQGAMDSIYESVILSDVVEDDERFRQIIDKAIREALVPDFPAYSKETKKKREARVKRAKLEAQAEAKEAEEYAMELGVHDKLFGSTKGKNSKGKGKGKDSSEDSLAALISKRQQERSANNFLDRLEEKYAAPSKGKKGSKRALPEEPPEEAFLAVGARKQSAKAAKEKAGSGSRAKRTRH